MKTTLAPTLTAALALSAGCSLAGQAAGPADAARPYRGALEDGTTVRAVVRTSNSPWVHTVAALYRSEPGPWSAEFLDFANRPELALPEPTLAVFRVDTSIPVHAPPDPDGSYEYYSMAFADLVAVEMAESEAVARARACLEALGTDAPETAAGEPFTHGPGERGGWLVRFAGVGAGEAVEFEIAAGGGCHRTR